ncbi:MAG: hypothetical protein SF052_27055 [Bacteroidia bacterium]|nr:hypothetical protein [Bacteroidia bacterium]
MKKTFLFLLLPLFFSGGQLYAQICDCLPPDNLSQALAGADLVFEGKVVFVNTNWMAGGMKYSFEVNRTWKRTAAKYLIVNTPWEKDCGYPFKTDSTYLVFVTKKFGLKTDGCMGNMPITKLNTRQPFTEVEYAPQNRSTGTDFLGYTLAIFLFLSLVFIALVVFRKKWYKPPVR